MRIGHSCKDKAKFIKGLRFINERAGVEPDIVDLIEAYARLRLQQGDEVCFYDNKIGGNDKELEGFLEKNRHLDHRALNFLASYYLEMKKRGLRCIFNLSHLAHILSISPQKLNWLTNDRAGHYICFHINKRNGKKRDIFAPKSHLKDVQRRILDDLLQRVRLNPHAQGFREKRSIVTNARRHIGKEVVVKMDVKDFFPSIGFDRVFGMFISLGYPRKVSLELTKLATHNGRLPIGAPTSPAISNIICRRLDKRFSALGEKTGFEYSRYADDLAISSHDKKMTRMIPFYKEIMREEGFEVNEAKLKILRSGSRQKITGIVVNKKQNIDRKEIKRLRAVIWNCSHKDIRQEITMWARKTKKLKDPYGYTIDEFKSSLLGKINFVRMVNPEAGKKLLQQFEALSLTSQAI
ncbi:MAG: reverse transcriptase family protein [Desulfobacteria bacterium]